MTLLDVQAKDAALAQLEHRRATLPEHARIEALEAEAHALEAQRVTAETEVGDLERAQAKFDTEIDSVRQRRVRDEDRLSSGAITNPKDLSSLQHELGALDRRISTLEDEELEIMQQLEDAQSRLSTVSSDVHRVGADLEHETAARDAALQVIDAEVASIREVRDEAAAGLPKDLRDLYDKVRSQHGGLGAAALRARRCEGCHLEINGADLRELGDKPDDDVLRCPECSRILVRTAESGL
ncbi:MAG: zinc ribbon domain-containing protein [Aeromicrobium sp.]